MKKNLFFSFVLFGMLLLSGFRDSREISNCFISFKASTDLTPAEPDRLPETPNKNFIVNTEHGPETVSRIDGYRILYNNIKKGVFVNLKVELSDGASYKPDQKKLIDNLFYVNSHSKGMETKEPVTLTLNGYTIHGISRASLESGNTLGIYIMFPGNGTTVYFYFNNLNPAFRNFETLEDYKLQRDRFLEEYTKYLTECR